MTAKKEKAENFVEELCEILLRGMEEIQADQEDAADGPYDELIAGYLGTDKDAMSIESKNFPPYKRNLMMIAVHRVVEENYNGGGLAFSINEYEDVQTPPHYMKVKSAPENEDKCLYYGYQQLETSDGQRFVLDIDCTNKVPYFNLITTINTVEIATEFIKQVDEFIEKRNIYRGQVVEIGSDGCLDFMKTPDRTWDDVIIPDDIKDELVFNTVWPIEKAEVFKKNGLPTKRGIMLEGRPGIGKTMAVSVIANTMKGKASTIWIPARSVGQADDIAQIYTAARELAPTILLFEDIDLIAADRSVAGNYSPILGELLGQLDGLEGNDTIITVATTNYPDIIEKALRDRPSRFDRRIQFELPTNEARRKMLDIFVEKITLDQDVNLDEIADESEAFTGAYMRELVSTAVIEALKENPEETNLVVNKIHFYIAIDKFKNKGKKFGFSCAE